MLRTLNPKRIEELFFVDVLQLKDAYIYTGRYFTSKTYELPEDAYESTKGNRRIENRRFDVYKYNLPIGSHVDVEFTSHELHLRVVQARESEHADLLQNVTPIAWCACSHIPRVVQIRI